MTESLRLMLHADTRRACAAFAKLRDDIERLGPAFAAAGRSAAAAVRRLGLVHEDLAEERLYARRAARAYDRSCRNSPAPRYYGDRPGRVASSNRRRRRHGR